MAKVMVSIPDELLARIDSKARETGRSRSAMLRDFANQAFGEQDGQLASRMRELNRSARGHGGNVSEVLKSSRPN